MAYVSVKLEQENLERTMRQFLSRQVPEARGVVVRKAAFDIVALTTRALNGVGGLPKRIDTGRLRAGWRVGLEAAGVSGSGIDAPNATGKIPTTSADGSGVTLETADEIQITVSNNVEYAHHVENGTSKMAPGHHLKRALSLSAKTFRDGLERAIVAAFEGRS